MTGSSCQARNRSKTMFSVGILLLIVCITQQSLCSENEEGSPDKAPPMPVFAKNYHVNGLLSLPYAELNEPFEAWFDSNNGKSRTDYYGDLYKIYQFAPKANGDEFGAMYKLTYVPADFHSFANEKKNNTSPSNQKRFSKSIQTHDFKQVDSNEGDQADSAGVSKTPTRRACFAADGGVGYTIQPQTVLPDLTDFSFDSIGPCPHVSAVEHRHSKCELWKLVNNVGDKKNVYKFWVRRQHDTGDAIPVHYYMLGFDSLLGSHYDRYDVRYYNYLPNGALDSDFEFDAQNQGCGPMPGPGDGADERALRSHMVLSNPIHEYVVEPHRYDHIDHEFDRFANENQKSYENKKNERQRWHNFLHNFRFINGKNRELKEFKLKVNRYADNKLGELNYLRGRLHSKGYNGGLDYGAHHISQSRSGSSNGKLNIDHLPESLDWTRLGAVSPVKDQAVCGSCWSFGTSGTIEGAYFVKTKKQQGDGKLLKLSQQQMVDCSWKFGNNGCDGGEDFRAYKYIMEAGGLSTEEDYGHYIGVDGKCHDRDVKKSVKISGFYNVTVNDVDALKHALYTYGPVTVSIDASQPTFTFYSHGVYYDPKCHNSPDELDHQVLVVGYTKIDGKLVWIVKNSWSTYWGDDGYIMMAAKDNNCGLMDAPTVPIIDLDDDKIDAIGEE